MKAERVIEIHGLSYDYPDGTPALKDIDLDVYRHESIAILGPNGAGKSTLLYHLNGTLMGGGKVSILGLPMRRNNLRRFGERSASSFKIRRINSSAPQFLMTWPSAPSIWGWMKKRWEAEWRRPLG